MLGRTTDEIVGKPIIDIIGPEAFETIRPYVEAVLRGQPVEYEAQIPYANVGARQVHVIYVPEHDDQNQVIGWIASIIDVTDHIKATEERDRLEKQFTHLMRVATLDGLVTTIVHELNQPLTSILANVEAAQAKLAAKSLDWEELAEILEGIRLDNVRVHQIIHELRQQVKTGEHREEAISLNSLVASTLHLLRAEMVKSKIKVDTDLETGLPPISGNLVALQQVLINLIMNAIEAMDSTPPSERSLSIVTRVTDDGNVEMTIRDRGPGVPPDDLKRIFEPFFTTKDKGLGVGLSICSGIIRSHRGQIILQNASGGGLVATITLPKYLQSPTAS